MTQVVILLLTVLATASAHYAGIRDLAGVDFPINPALGVSGYPDCVNPRLGEHQTQEEAGMDLVCAQRLRGPSSVRIACVGDSITAGVHSSGGNHTYPSRLQMQLDAAYGWGAYSVTNLGACGSTMMKGADSPFWQRPQYTTLTANKWDIVIIMLGTNDAKDKGSGGPPNWPHNCTRGGAGGTAPVVDLSCPFAQDYESLVEVARTLGTTPAGPRIYTAVPPPLVRQGAYGMNQTVINDVLPRLVRAINTDAAVHTAPIDVFAGMGGDTRWRDEVPAKGCTLNSSRSWRPCQWWCDAQSCDQCHPNDQGYQQLARTVFAALDLPPPPAPTPPTPGPPALPGAWLYEDGGAGKRFIGTATNFTENRASGRGGALAWDACPATHANATFDNGVPIWPAGGGCKIGAVRASGGAVLRGSSCCGHSYNYPNMTLSGAFAASDGIRYQKFVYLEVVEQ